MNLSQRSRKFHHFDFNKNRWEKWNKNKRDNRSNHTERLKNDNIERLVIIISALTTRTFGWFNCLIKIKRNQKHDCVYTKNYYDSFEHIPAGAIFERDMPAHEKAFSNPVQTLRLCSVFEQLINDPCYLFKPKSTIFKQYPIDWLIDCIHSRYINNVNCMVIGEAKHVLFLVFLIALSSINRGNNNFKVSSLIKKIWIVICIARLR